MSRPWMRMRSPRDTRRKLILDTIAFLFTIVVVVIGFPILFASAPIR